MTKYKKIPQTVRELKKGDLFILDEKNNGVLYVRGEYIRTIKKFECSRYDDVSAFRYFKGDKNILF